jgi:hypothetical protein
MAIIYNSRKKELEEAGYTPFICIVKWRPEEELAFLARWSQLYTTPEGEGVKGIHTWNLVGKNTMLFIGWMNSALSLQKFCTSITYGTDFSIEVCPAIDHFALKETLDKLKSRMPKIPVPKVAARKSGASKAKR